jgi:tetratricopeptide (TPR) repeat protein
VSTDSDKKNGQVGGDWDTALEEWDESPLVPALADDKTPAPPGAAATPTPEPAEAAAGISTVRPPADLRPAEEEEDEECTVVGEIPAELLADSIRGLGSASGLGQIFGRGTQPTIPAEDEVDQSQEVRVDDAVYTSAPSVPMPDTAGRAAKVQPPSDAGGDDALDPFADLRDDLASPAPSDATPLPDADATPLPSDDAKEPSKDSLAVGPKLLEPDDRQYPQDEVTEVFAGEEAMNKLVEAGAVLSAPTARVRPPEPGMPRSVPPPAVEPPKAPWSDERDAAAHVLERNLRAEWEARAAWFAEEAAVREDGAQRARVMLAISELCAMVGDDEKGVAVARAARDLDPDHPLIQRQARYAATRERRWFDVIGELEAEARTAPTPEAKVHALLMIALLTEQLHNDDVLSGKQLDLAARILPTDPRPYVAKLVRRLNDESGKVPPVRWPEDPVLAPLAEGALLAGRIRQAQDAPAVPGEEVGVYEAVPRAKAALRVSDTKAAARALRALDAVRGMGGGALWLAASLAGQDAESRSQAMSWFDKLAAGPHSAVAVRLLALRAVESGDTQAMRRALSVPGSGAFTPADRAVLAALFHEDLAEEPFVGLLLVQQETAVLGAALRAALADVDAATTRLEACSVGPASLRSLCAVARATSGGSGAQDFWERVAALRDAHPDGWVARLLEVEMAIDQGLSDQLIDQLAGWGGGGAGLGERDRALAAGVVAEMLDDRERAAKEYDRAIQIDPEHEGVIRALRSLDAPAHVARVIELAAQADGAKGAVFALEAALASGPGEDVYLDLLRQSHEKDPSLPFAAVLGERLARLRGDVEGVLEWVRSRRDATQDAMEASFDACREAMLMVERDASLAASLMEQASRARPADAALRALYERFHEGRPEDWVAWRVDRAAESEGPEKARLLLEAALECEREGQADTAAKLALQALEAGAGDLAARCLERCELAGASTSSLTDSLMGRARQEDLPAQERREVQERLAELDEVGRKDLASALLWHRSILEQDPQHLPSLRRIEHAYVGMGRDADLESIAAELVKTLQGPEVDAHAVVASRIRLREAPWTDLADLCKAAGDQPNPSLWALRCVFAQARVRGDDATVSQTAKVLSGMCDNEVESAALLVQAAHALARMGEHEEASQLFQMAIDREPGFVHAHLDLVDVLERTGEHARAAEELETLARKSSVDEHRAQLWYRAAEIWTEKVEELDRGRRAFEEVSDIDIGYRDVFDRLRVLYTEAGDATELAALLERKLEAITDPDERIEMEVLRGRALADVGEVGGAKRALAAALEANPDHQPALEAFVAVSVKEEDWPGAEQALIRLARLVPEPERQAAIYRQLGTIYLDHIPDLERAEASLREVLKRNPDDAEAQGRLIDVFRETGEAEKAIALCTQLMDQASTPEAKRERTIQLALIHEQLEGDVKKAQDMLDRLYKQAPSVAISLRALAEFHKRQGHDKPLEMLLDRASKDSARALRTGRFSPDLFAILETVAMVRSDEVGAAVARAVVDVLEGERDVPLPAFGPAACSVNLDDILAPEVVDASLRALLKRAGDLLEAAFPMDLKALRATDLPPTSADLQEAIVGAAAGMGIQDLRVLVSPALGPTCVPIQSHPPIIVLGSSMLTTEDTAVRDFLLIRALKIVQTRGCVLSRTAPIDLLPTVAALVKTLAPSFQPSAIDARRFTEALQKLTAVKPASIDPDVEALALEFGGSLDNRASTLNVAVNGWGDRAALLAQGLLTIALKAIAWSGGHPSGPPASGKDRMTWIGRNAEARDLIVFVASESYGDARRRLGT